MGGWGGLGYEGPNAVAQWRKVIVGDWVEELSGIDLLHLKPVTGRTPMRLNLLADGTLPPSRPEAPFPERWELTDDRVLTLTTPIRPMPEYGMLEWTRDHLSFDVLAVTEMSLALSNRRFDGETVFVCRRVNDKR